MNFRKISTVLSTVLFLLYCAWWVWLELTVAPESDIRNGYSLTYGILAGIGGILGFIIAKKWGGFKSYVGKSLIFFAFGLFCQFLGQNAYSLQFLIDHVENAYPSWGEIFFFVSMPSYILAVWFIGRAAGSIVALKKFKFQLLSLVLTVLIVGASYYKFVYGMPTEGMSFLEIFLSYAYPIGQALFVSLAIISYILSGKILGGFMKRRVVLILFSLVFQYAADALFLHKVINGTWYHADFSEFMFAVSYSLMTFAFIDFSVVFDELKGKS